MGCTVAAYSTITGLMSFVISQVYSLWAMLCCKSRRRCFVRGKSRPYQVLVCWLCMHMQCAPPRQLHFVGLLRTSPFMISSLLTYYRKLMPGSSLTHIVFAQFVCLWGYVSYVITRPRQECRPERNCGALGRGDAAGRRC